MGEAETNSGGPGDRWLLLIHQLPAKPAYLRVKIWRRLQGLGAVTVKNSVYALPATEQAEEDLEWVLREIAEGDGEGMICESRLIDGLSDQELRALFNAARDAEYETLAADARAVREMLSACADRGEAKARLAKLRASFAQAIGRDFFGADGREAVGGLIAALEDMLREEMAVGDISGERTTAQEAGLGPLQGRVWVTRQGVHVDRIASAWLIRRFIDPKARFKFVPAKGYLPEPDELRFDMFEAEFTHEGDRCTFEVLLARAGLADPALVAIGEIVHDIDLKDAKFGREETAGIARLIAGVATANRGDPERIERGGAILDDLYGSFRKTKG